MNAKHFVAVATAVVSIGFFWASGCSSSSSGGETCAVGSETCPCTAGGSCDRGLACLSNRCVKLGDAAVSTAVGAGGAGTGGTTTSSTTTGSGGTAGATGTGGAGGGGTGPGALGSTCTATSQCRTGLICMTPTDDLATGAGAPNGICTLECTSAPATACAPYNGFCAAFESGPLAKGFCMETCASGVAATAMNMKCHLRQDTACATFTDSAGNTVATACVPLCTDDTECGTRKCNPATGLCEATKMAGAPLGGACMVDTDCAGFFCLPFNANPGGGPAPGACSEFCRFGNTTAGCHFRITPLDASTAPAGACLYSATDGNVGDLGACGQLCDVPGDCLATFPQYTCVQDPNIKRVFGHGYCGFPLPDASP